jgi:hypothetical protein
MPISKNCRRIDPKTEGLQNPMTRTMDEKRRFPRHRVKSPAMLEMFDRSLPVFVLEMSVDGFRIQAASSIAPETHIAVRINVGREIVFHGQVMWVTDMLTAAKGPAYNMGIQTDAILDRSEELIDFGDREVLIQDLVIIMKRV